MKVGEARGIYSSVLKSYNQQKFKLSKQRNELKERMESTPDGKTLYADEAATLDLQYNAVAEKQDEYQDYVDQLMEQWESKFNSVAAKQQDEAAKDYSEEMGKIMTVARRIMHGDIVPAQDAQQFFCSQHISQLPFCLIFSLHGQPVQWNFPPDCSDSYCGPLQK